MSDYDDAVGRSEESEGGTMSKKRKRRIRRNLLQISRWYTLKA